MDRATRRRLEEYRRGEAGPIENTLIDELASGELDRAEFMRRGAMFGVSVAMLGTVLGALGEAPLALGAPRAQKVGGRLRLVININQTKSL